MTLKKHLPQAILITLFTLFIGLVIVRVVQAGAVDSVNVGNINADQFPRVTIDLNGQVNELNGFSVKNIVLSEEGRTNHGPMVYLPPKAPGNLVDVFVILDYGTTAVYQDSVKMNVEVLMQTLQDSGVDTKVYLNAFDAPDSSIDEPFAEFTQVSELADHLNGLEFDPLVARGFILRKLFQAATANPRPGAEKVVVLVNGSGVRIGEQETTYTIPDTVQALGGTPVFVVGLPEDDLHALKTQEVEDASLSHALPGGYAGGFGSDFGLLIPQMLASRSGNKGLLMYYSNLDKEKTGPVELSIFGETVQIFHYPNLDRSDPGYFLHLNAGSIKWGEPVTIDFKVDPIHQLVGMMQVYYLDANSQTQVGLAKPQPNQNTEEGLHYQFNLAPGDYPQEYLRYSPVAYTPYGPIGSLSNLVSLPVNNYEEGIVLEPTLQNDSILWKWSGPTVDAGTTYELRIGGDDASIVQTNQKQLDLPVDDCFAYQVVYVRSKVNGEWSLFSAPGEAYLGPQGTFTELEGIQKMLECVEDPAFNSVNGVVQGNPDYKPNKNLYLEKTLSYLTRVVDPQTDDQIKFGRYRLFYLLLQYIGQVEHDEYNLGSDHIPWSLLYKLIAQVNYTGDLEANFEWGLNELDLRLEGLGTI